MKYNINITRSAQKDLSKLPIKDYEKTIREINNLSDNPRPKGCKKLSGREGWRIRIGDFRVIYNINDSELIVLVIEVGHRREVYK
jgi:mRNA interferase RelE/StbE